MKGSASEAPISLTRLEYVSLSDACYTRLKELILGRVLDWGQKLDVQSLAHDFGVSRAPVIKAIDRLAFEGLVDVSPNRGSFVRRPTKEAVLEVAEARAAFELAALDLAYHKDPKTLVERLQNNEETIQAFVDGSSAITERDFIEYDTKFHSIITDGSKNETLVKLSTVLRNQIELFRRQSYANDMAEASIKMHRAVLAALHKGDLPIASAALKRHIEEVAEEYIVRMDDGL